MTVNSKGIPMATEKSELDEATAGEEETPPEPVTDQALESSPGLVESIVVEKKRPRGYRYTSDDRIQLVAAAKQRHTLGESWVEVAKALFIAYPTLKPMLEADGVVIEGRGRRPKLPGTPRKTRPKATTAPRKSRPQETASETPISSHGKGTRFKVTLDTKQFVDDNFDEVFRVLMMGQPEGIKDAIRRLLER
jgi:hypothetical protein